MEDKKVHVYIAKQFAKGVNEIYPLGGLADPQDVLMRFNKAYQEARQWQ